MPQAFQLVAAFVALEHFGFFVLETFLWTKPAGRKIFRTTAEAAAATRSLAQNQGVYNAFLAAGILFALWLGDLRFVAFFLACVVVAGLVGAVTVNKRIFLVQGVPAVVGLVLVWIARS